MVLFSCPNHWIRNGKHLDSGTSLKDASLLIASTSTLAQADELFCPFGPLSLKDKYNHLDIMINVFDMICLDCKDNHRIKISNRSTQSVFQMIFAVKSHQHENLNYLLSIDTTDA